MPELSHETIELLAYSYWEERGRPFGSPEIDWFRAENDLRQANESESQDPAIVAAAKAIGSAVGSVVHFAAHLIPTEQGPES